MPTSSRCAKGPYRTDVVRIPYVKYSTGANKATRTAHRAIGKPDSTVARRAFLTGRAIGEWHAESKSFLRDSAISRLQRLFFAYFFLTSQKKVCPRSDIAPPAHTKRAIRRKKTPPFWGFFYAQSYPHVDVDCLQIFCSQLRNRCFTKLPVDRSDFRAHLPVDK